MDTYPDCKMNGRYLVQCWQIGRPNLLKEALICASSRLSHRCYFLNAALRHAEVYKGFSSVKTKNLRLTCWFSGSTPLVWGISMSKARDHDPWHCHVQDHACAEELAYYFAWSVIVHRTQSGEHISSIIREILLHKWSEKMRLLAMLRYRLLLAADSTRILLVICCMMVSRFDTDSDTGSELPVYLCAKLMHAFFGVMLSRWVCWTVCIFHSSRYIMHTTINGPEAFLFGKIFTKRVTQFSKIIGLERFLDFDVSPSIKVSSFFYWMTARC